VIHSKPLATLLPAALAVAGIVHLLFPRVLLRTARLGYDRLLAVEFHPRERAPRRVRAVGVLLLAAAVACRQSLADPG